ncbi:MAG: hypothetical protein KF905_04420 [Flavobacteriales bacterium]|nr:hypothetical protein [Flavobacteriales bacterium]
MGTIGKSVIVMLACLLMSCAALGTRTTYRSDPTPTIKSMGYVELVRDSQSQHLFPRTNEVFHQTVVSTLNAHGVDDIREIGQQLPFEAPDPEKIAELCGQYEVDALLLSRLVFVHNKHLLPTADDNFSIGESHETKVEMKLFDRHGMLIVAARHNTTMGKLYFKIPEPDRTVRDGAEGAAKRIARVLVRRQ